jgi:hypothetical protein
MKAAIEKNSASRKHSFQKALIAESDSAAKRFKKLLVQLKNLLLC